MAWVKRTGIMLCQPVDERNLARNFKMFPTMLAQPKLDGMRCWVQWRDGQPILVSSQGEFICSVPHIELALKKFIDITEDYTELDGELYVHKMPFERIISICKRSMHNLHPDRYEMQYHIFDYKSDEPQVTRLCNLKNWFAKWHKVGDPILKNIIQRVHTVPTDRPGVENLLQQFLDEGYEGIILRNPMASYVEKRPYTILKWKPSKSDWYEILDVEEAISEDGFPLARVGALLCVDRFGNTFKCGTGLGLTHHDASLLWVRRNEIIGQYAHVYYQNLTNNGVPRFGKFAVIQSIDKTSGENH